MENEEQMRKSKAGMGTDSTVEGVLNLRSYWKGHPQEESQIVLHTFREATGQKQ